MKNLIRLYPVILFSLVAGSPAGPDQLRAQDWEFHGVDIDGENPSLVIGPDQVPRLAYFVAEPGSMVVIHAYWEPEIQGFTSEIAAVGPFRLQASIAVDSLHQPHITFHDHHLGNPIHAWKDGADWVQDDVFSPNHDGWSSSVAIGSDNFPRFSFNDGGDIGGVQGGEGIEYAWYDGTDWNVQPIGSEVGLYWFCGTSLALTQSDSAYIAYYNDIEGNLMLASGIQGGAWAIIAVDTAGDVGKFPSLKLDNEERPHIGYYQELSESSGVVKLASFDGSDWVIITIDTLYSVDLSEDIEGMISLAIDTSGRCHLSYADQSTLKYAVYDWSQVVRQVVLANPEPRLSQATSLALGPNEEPHLAYTLDGADGGVYYAVSMINGRFSPAVSDIPDQVATRPGGWKISLDEFVNDPDHGDEEISWSYSGNVNFIVNYSATKRTVSIAPPEGWKGSDTITFTATDPDDLSGSDDAVFWFGPPVVSDIPDQATGADTDFFVNLTAHVKDVDHEDSELHWSFSGIVSLVVLYDSVAQTARISVPSGWSGGETITFTATDPDGFSDSDDATFSVLAVEDLPTGVLGESIPEQTGLEQNYPNPFNPSTRISFRLTEQTGVSLRIYNMLGQEVRTLVDEVRNAGLHAVVWDGRDDLGRSVASGMYLYRMETKEFVETRRMLLVK